MTLRAFTSGYDLFHPIENVAWHDYVRAYAIRHWEDHASEETTSIAKSSFAWSDLDGFSQKKVRQLLGAMQLENHTTDSSDLLGRYGLGSMRSREEYERYAGVSFALRKVQDYTRYAHEPPNPETSPDWADRIYTWLVRVAVNVAKLPPGALDDLGFWVVTIQDEDRREIRRHDFQRKELNVSGNESEIVLICEIQSGIIPVFWSVQPFSRFGGGGIRLDGVLTELDFTIVKD
jgi:hypothetical protein